MHEHLEFSALLSEVAEVLHPHHVHVQRDIISTQVIQKSVLNRGAKDDILQYRAAMAPVQEPEKFTKIRTFRISWWSPQC